MYLAQRVPTYIQRKRRQALWENVALVAGAIVGTVVALMVRSTY